MLRLLESHAHARRLRELVAGFEAEERRMTCVLRTLQSRLEAGHREASCHQIAASPDAPAWLDRCSELQQQCDALAAELAHCRLAIAGTSEELAQHGGRRTDCGDSRLLGA